MTKRSLAVLALVYVPHTISQPKPSPITIGETVQLQSNMLKESRSLLIAKPAGYDNGTERYPVLYLLDGELHVNSTSGIQAFGRV